MRQIKSKDVKLAKIISNSESSKRFRISFKKMREANFDVWNRFYYKLRYQTYSTSKFDFRVKNDIRIFDSDSYNNSVFIGDENIENSQENFVELPEKLEENLCIPLGLPNIARVLYHNIGLPSVRYDDRKIGRHFGGQRGSRLLHFSIKRPRRRWLAKSEFIRRKFLKQNKGIFVGLPLRPRRKKNILANIKFNRKIFCLFLGNMKRSHIKKLYKKIHRYGMKREFLGKLEKRLDMFLLRTQLVRNLFLARQSIRCGHICVNGRVINSFNYTVNVYDIVSVVPGMFNFYRFNFLRRLYFGMFRSYIPCFLEVNYFLLQFMFVPYVYKSSVFNLKNKFHTNKMPYRIL